MGTRAPVALLEARCQELLAGDSQDFWYLDDDIPPELPEELCDTLRALPFAHVRDRLRAAQRFSRATCLQATQRLRDHVRES
eukprot:5889044-Alexandrium_andersonii.AAC.1